MEKLQKQGKQARRELVHSIKRTAKDLRWQVEHLLDDEEKKRAARIAHDLDNMADDIEHRTKQTLDEVTTAAVSNVWSSIAITFFIGVFIGIIIQQLRDD